MKAALLFALVAQAALAEPCAGGQCAARDGGDDVVSALSAGTENDASGLLQIHPLISHEELSTDASTSESCDGPGDSTMNARRVVEVTNDAEAVCNDGTSAVYYWAPARCPRDAKKWVVFLGGGGWCWDYDSCAKRSPDSVSSKDYPEFETPDPDSLFGNHSPFFNYNKISIRQCSSDAWMGDIGADDNAAKVNWRGARIVRSLLRHLVANEGLGHAEVLLFGGGSAGARGAMVHLDALKKEGVVPLKLPIFGLLDSPYYIEMPPFRNLTGPGSSLSLQTQLVAENMQNEAILRGRGSCKLGEAWRCAFGQDRIPLLQTPFILIASRYDRYGISVLEGYDFGLDVLKTCFPEPRGEYYTFAGAYAGRVHRGLTTLPQVLKGDAGLYSTTCYQHAESANPVYGQQKLMGTSMVEAIKQGVDAFMAWPWAKKKMPYIVDETCDFVNCGQYCMSEANASCLSR